MRIAIIRKRYSFHGGAEGFSQSLLRLLAEEGHEVHIYAIEWAGIPPRENVFFHSVPAVVFNSFLRDLTFAIACFLLLKKRKNYYDVIQSHDKTLYQDLYRAGDGCHIEWLNQRLKRRGIFGRWGIKMNPYHWLVLRMERMILKGHRFRKIIAISGMVKRNIIEHYGVDESDIAVVYNGVDLKRFRPQNRDLYRNEIRKRYAVDESEFVLLCVGSGFERKGIRYILQAIERITAPLTLIIAGRGSAEKYRSLIQRQTVIFCGPQKEIHKFYAASDVFVSTPIYEPFGNACLEALASGIPIITTRLSGASEILEDGREGFLVNEPEDTGFIAEKINRLMDRDVQERMCRDARKLAERYSLENHIHEMMRVYDTIKPDLKIAQMGGRG